MTSIPRPRGHHSVTPSAVVGDTAAVIQFCTEALSGEVLDRYDGPEGVVYHAEVLIGDSVVMFGAPTPDIDPMPAALSVYVDDADAVEATYRKAIKAGATSMSEPTTQPWGYRSACVRDSGGNRWTICAIIEELTHDEIMRRMQDGPGGALVSGAQASGTAAPSRSDQAATRRLREPVLRRIGWPAGWRAAPGRTRQAARHHRRPPCSRSVP